MKLNIFSIIIFILIISNASFARERVWKNDPFALNDDMVNNQKADNNMTFNKTGFTENDTEILLQGIWQVGTIYKAMISDTIVNVGMKVNGYLVQAINSQEVTLRATKSGRLLILEYRE